MASQVVLDQVSNYRTVWPDTDNKPQTHVSVPFCESCKKMARMFPRIGHLKSREVYLVCAAGRCMPVTRLFCLYNKISQSIFKMGSMSRIWKKFGKFGKFSREKGVERSPRAVADMASIEG
jgi:hypothetical protein